MKKLRFYKKEYKGNVRWWADIRPWIFPDRLLIMYPSAEEWLEKIGKGSDDITILYATEAFPEAEILRFHNFEGLVKGALYVAESYKGESTNHKVLLCPVTLYVFGRYPQVIYYRVIP